MTISTWTPPSQIITGITNANPGVVTTAQNHGYQSGLFVRLVLPGNFGMSQVNNNVYEIVVLSPTTFAINQDTTQFYPFLQGQASITNITKSINPVVSVSADVFTQNQIVYIYQVQGMTDINNFYYRVIAVAPGTITIRADSRDFDAYGSGGLVIAIQDPQVIPVAEQAFSLTQAERNSLPPTGS